MGHLRGQNIAQVQTHTLNNTAPGVDSAQQDHPESLLPPGRDGCGRGGGRQARPAALLHPEAAPTGSSSLVSLSAGEAVIEKKGGGGFMDRPLDACCQAEYIRAMFWRPLPPPPPPPPPPSLPSPSWIRRLLPSLASK